MASSSSSSPLPYEVFLSFRGEDTRNNFVSHLHAALDGKGIRTYFDETNLQKGQTIGPELIKAIEESSMAIVVLSTNYGSSTWCLNELVKIMERKHKSGLIVFPIFYHVYPSDVRKQQNSFFQHFSNHEVNFKDDILKVASWRKALKEVADLSGKDIRGKNEASCIKEIADKILMQLPVKASQFRKSVVGIEPRISKIKKMMYDKPNEVLFIGLWGMGGIGKTTTAIAIFEDCKNEFQGSCFLKDVRQIKDRMHDLQKKLLSSVLDTKFEDIYDVAQGSSMIQERLQFKKILLVIDDVDDVDQLDALARHCGWFGGGSRIIVTTRDAHLLNDNIAKFDVPTLPEKEALHLFCFHAFKDEHPHEDFGDLSLQVLKYAAGLPLALRVLGCHLFNRKKYFWEATLKKLKKLKKLKEISTEKIISTLKISFDGLDDFQKDIFLDIACFFRGWSKQEVEERLEILGLYPKEGIDVLIQKSLINVTFDHIGMHDLLQDMGWYIVRQRSNWDVTKYSHIWLKKDLEYVLSNIKVSFEAERIFIRDVDDIQFKLGWEHAFLNMNKLSYLQLYGGHFDEGNNEDVNVSQSVGQHNNTLRLFSWFGYPGKSLPKSFHSMNLIKLHMEDSRLEETPDFSQMPNLKELDLSRSEKLVHIHPSLGDHVNIKHINLDCCREIKEFPKINQMTSLEILILSYTDLQSFPEIYGNLDSLRELQLWGTSITELPTSLVGNAICLQKLELACHHRSFDEEFISLAVVEKSFPGLVCLEITGSGIVRTLDFSHLPHLEKLNLSDSKKLVEVHASLGVHRRVKYINLKNCSKLVEFPKICDMNSLKDLDLSYTRLRSFPEIYGNLDSLRKLELRGTSINGLPTSIPGNAICLQKLELACHWPFDEEFISLAALTNSFPGLVCLEIIGSGIVRTLDFSHLPHLEKLNLSHSKELVEVHASLGDHKRIEFINLSGCSKLVEFPKICDMNSLEELDLSYTRLQSFPEMEGNVSSLEKLKLDGTEITTLPWSIGNAISLEYISMQDCHNLLTLPISFLGVEFRKLLISSGALKYFKGSIDDEVVVPKEVELHSPQRKRRKKLIGWVGMMGQNLSEQMHFSDCKRLEELPEFLLSRVKFLIITECPTLTSWICINMVDLLNKYQDLCVLQLHQRDGIGSFSKLESMSNMLRKREKHFEVKVPGRQIPSWLQYKISGRSVSIFLPPLSEWYSDKFKGFVLSGINAASTSGYFHFPCNDCCPGELHILVMCIPIDNIREAMHFREGEKDRTLFSLSSRSWLDASNEYRRWGLSLVYSEGEVIELDPHKVMIVIDNVHQSPYEYTFRINIAESRDVIEELYRFKNPISWASFQQQTHSQAGMSAMAQDLSAPPLLSLFPSGPDLRCYQEGEPSRISYGKDGDSELDLRLSLNSHMMM